MNDQVFFDTLRQGLWISVIISAPLLVVALAAGVTIGLFQALTSVQEMTLTFVPKILAVFLGLLFAAPWMLEKVTTFTVHVIENIPMYIR